MLTFNLLKECDIELLRNWRNSYLVSKYLFTSPNITKEDQDKWFDKYKMSNNHLFWIIKYNTNKIGYMDLRAIDFINKKADPGVYICDNNYRHKGFGKISLINL